MGSAKYLQVYGLISSPQFHSAKCAAEDLYYREQQQFKQPQINELTEFQWRVKVEKRKLEIKGEMWKFEEKSMVFVDGILIGDSGDFLRWAKEECDYRDYRERATLLYKAMANEAYENYMGQEKLDFVYLDISIDGIPKGKLVFELYKQFCPKTCENFKKLCSGEKGVSEMCTKLHYLNTLIHRIVPNGWIQGGDVVNSRGAGGESIFGGTFEDESFAVKHDCPGRLGMANKGRHTNGSQFYITLNATPWMDCRSVAFGQLLEGYDLIMELQQQNTYNERPKKDCLITDCGVYTYVQELE